MDRHLKERLVGAAVLVAAAIVLIPEMLSGPHDAARVEPELKTANSADESAVKTYTIDLAAPQAEQQRTEQPSVEIAAAPPPEVQPAARPVVPAEKTKPQDTAPAQSVKTQASLDRSASTAEEIRATKIPEKHVVAAPVPTPTPTTTLKPEDKPVRDAAWAVQIASFGVRTTADRLAAELATKGFPTFVTSFAVKGQTMYRVRVGPVANRDAAEGLLKKIKPLHSGAAVVAQ